MFFYILNVYIIIYNKHYMFNYIFLIHMSRMNFRTVKYEQVPSGIDTDFDRFYYFVFPNIQILESIHYYFIISKKFSSVYVLKNNDPFIIECRSIFVPTIFTHRFQCFSSSCRPPQYLHIVFYFILDDRKKGTYLPMY